MLVRVLAVVVLGLAAHGCGGPSESAGPPMKMPAAESTGEPMGTSTGELEIAGDRCTAPRLVRAGRHRGTLAGTDSELGGTCGGLGPELFFQVEIDRPSDLEVQAVGAGFVPRLAVLQSCDEDADDLVLRCAHGLPAHVLDLGVGAAPIIMVGADDGAEDGGEFLLDVRLRAILGADEECSPPGRGRCVSGTACLTDEAGVDRCTVLAADTCATAESHTLALGETLALAIDPNAAQTDAHASACTGARRRDRVLRLELPADLPPTTMLRITSDAADVGFAVRGATCSPDDELACAEPSDDGLELVVDDVAMQLGSDRAMFVFVELPHEIDSDSADARRPGELPPLPVSFELAAL